MDWKQFFASVISSVAWPAIVGLLLYLLRDKLTGLVDRVIEVNLPGGVKASFKQNLEVGGEIADGIPHAADASTPPEMIKEIAFFNKIAGDSPPGAVILAFIEVEKRLQKVAVKLGKPYWSDQRKLMRELVDRNLIDPKTVQLFISLKNARNSAAHANGGVDLSAAQATEYIRQAGVLAVLLQEAADKL